MRWLEDPFGRYTKSSNQSDFRLLIMDGHDSHTNSIQFIEYCMRNGIIAYCLPLHSAHILQPLDVGLFGPLKRSYTQHAADTLAIDIVIQKANFVPLNICAHNEAYTIDNILSAFRNTGIVPLNSRLILSKIS